MKKILTLLLLAPTSALALEAQKIATIKGDTQTLWQFLAALPKSFEAQIFYALFLSGVVGAIASWLWKWSQGNAGLKHFNLKYTIGQVLWLAGSAIAAIFTVGFSTESGEFFGWLSVLWLGAMTGFGGEVKTERPVWDAQTRAAQGPPGP